MQSRPASNGAPTPFADDMPCYPFGTCEWFAGRRKDKAMSELETAVGISITNQCHNCLMLDEVCPECEDLRQANDATIAHQIVDEGNLQYHRVPAVLQDEPSGHDWITSTTRTRDGKVRNEFMEPTTWLIDRLFDINVEMPPNSVVCNECHYTFNQATICPNCN